MSHNYKILIVDDSELVACIIQDMIGDEYEYLIARDGLSALGMARDNNPDLILLDVTMPELSGHEVCEQIRLDDAIKDIPIIFLTSLDNPEDIEKGFSVGGNDYISKPFNQMELKARVFNQFKYLESKRLIAENEQLKTFHAVVTGLNHEIKNPLAVLKGNLYVLSGGSEGISEKGIADMNNAIDAIDHLVEKISEVESIKFEDYVEGQNSFMIDIEGSSKK